MTPSTCVTQELVYYLSVEIKIDESRRPQLRLHHVHDRRPTPHEFRIGFRRDSALGLKVEPFGVGVVSHLLETLVLVFSEKQRQVKKQKNIGWSSISGFSWDGSL